MNKKELKEEGYYWVQFTERKKWIMVELRVNYDGRLSQVEDTCYGPCYISVERFFGDDDKIVGPIKEPD